MRGLVDGWELMVEGGDPRLTRPEEGKSGIHPFEHEFGWNFGLANRFLWLCDPRKDGFNPPELLSDAPAGRFAGPVGLFAGLEPDFLGLMPETVLPKSEIHGPMAEFRGLESENLPTKSEFSARMTENQSPAGEI